MENTSEVQGRLSFVFRESMYMHTQTPTNTDIYIYTDLVTFEINYRYLCI